GWAPHGAESSGAAHPQPARPSRRPQLGITWRSRERPPRRARVAAGPSRCPHLRRRAGFLPKRPALARSLLSERVAIDPEAAASVPRSVQGGFGRLFPGPNLHHPFRRRAGIRRRNVLLPRRLPPRLIASSSAAVRQTEATVQVRVL